MWPQITTTVYAVRETLVTTTDDFITSCQQYGWVNFDTGLCVVPNLPWDRTAVLYSYLEAKPWMIPTVQNISCSN